MEEELCGEDVEGSPGAFGMEQVRYVGGSFARVWWFFTKSVGDA